MPPPQLRLTNVDVRVAKDGDPSRHDPADVGTRVWLDVPDKKSQFTFQEFKVIADKRNKNKRRLVRPGQTGNATAQIDRSLRYWCVWDKKNGSVTSAPSGFHQVQGFGFPLLAKLKGHQLILPNFCWLVMREFNLSGAKITASRIDVNRDRLLKLCELLHIRTYFNLQPHPTLTNGKPCPTLQARLGNAPKGLFDTNDPNTNLHDLTPAPPATPLIDFNKSPWVPTKEKGRTIIVVWVDRIETPLRSTGVTELVVRRAPKPVIGAIVKRPMKRSVIFIPVRGSTQNNEVKHAGSNADLAHELGHCLLSDPGLGRNVIDPEPTWKARVIRMLHGLSLNRSGQDLYKRLPKTYHDNRSSKNLMSSRGPDDTTLTGRGLLHSLQVAIMREAPELQ